MGHPERLPTALLAVRHGESTANALFAEAEAAGATEVPITSRDADIPLTARGLGQCRALARRLALRPAQERPQSIWCSPYDRTRQTAEPLLAALGGQLPLRIDERLRDRELGVLEMLPAAAIEARHPEEAARRRRLGELYYRPPGGESCADVALRLRSLLTDLAEREAGRRVLLVCHDAVVLMLRYVVEELDEAGMLAVHTGGGRVRNASLSEWRLDGGRLRAVCWNDTAHLPG
ncbi:histidine phosphatase family protein [Peterkaempfera griseoplana]|uniref:histidine phosphatase family protein n=1 Tax=Peterkaempfera griseoplana TaxID=66896 RepID=UPI0006E1D3B3|nr:histidine phosphatase family protein [Peterkaempfera griseoplana]